MGMPGAIIGGSLIGGIASHSAASKSSKSILRAGRESREAELEMWERQFGGPSDALKLQMMDILGYTSSPLSKYKTAEGKEIYEDVPIGGEDTGVRSVLRRIEPTYDVPEGSIQIGDQVYSRTPGVNPWLDRYKSTMRTEIESGIRPGEEAARQALLDKVRANPMMASGASLARGLSDISQQSARERGTAFRSGMSQAELTPVNMAMSFLNRTPFIPQATYPPPHAYPEPNYMATGQGLFETINQGMNLYDRLKPTPASGFEFPWVGQGNWGPE